MEGGEQLLVEGGEHVFLGEVCAAVASVLAAEKNLY